MDGAPVAPVRRFFRLSVSVRAREGAIPGSSALAQLAHPRKCEPTRKTLPSRGPSRMGREATARPNAIPRSSRLRGVKPLNEAARDHHRLAKDQDALAIGINGETEKTHR